MHCLGDKKHIIRVIIMLRTNNGRFVSMNCTIKIRLMIKRMNLTVYISILLIFYVYNNFTKVVRIRNVAHIVFEKLEKK